MHFFKSLPIDVFVLEVSEQSESIIKYTSLMHGFVNSFLGGGGEERLAAPWLKAMIHESLILTVFANVQGKHTT